MQHSSGGVQPRPPTMPRHLTIFRIVKPARKITFYYLLISRMPQFTAMWPKNRQAVVCSTPQVDCNHGISPTSTYNAQTPLLFQDCQTSHKNHFYYSVISRMPQFGQKQVGGSLQHSLGGVQPRDQPPIRSICPDTSPFSELSNQPEKSLFVNH